MITKSSVVLLTHYTNSVIRVPQFELTSQTTINYYRSQHCQQQQNKVLINKDQEYNCSPLDANCYIHAYLIQNNEIKKKYVYGPILYQNMLANHPFSVCFTPSLILNKNIPYCCKITFLDKQTHLFELKVKGQKLQFSKQFGKCQYWSNFQTHSDQSNTVYINIISIRKQFIDFLKKIQIAFHFGDYIKIIFENRIIRDLFLLNIKEWKHDLFKNNQPNKVTLIQINNSMNNINNNDDQNSISQQFARIFENQPQQHVTHQLQGRPFKNTQKIVYNPMYNSMKSIKKKDKLSINRNQTSSKYYINKNVNQNIDTHLMVQEDNQLVQEREDNVVDNYNKRGINTQRNNITRINSEVILMNNPQEIKNLVKINIKLAKQNQKLKQQNQNLKLQLVESQRKGSSWQSTELKQIKSMIKQMNQRIILVQQKFRNDINQSEQKNMINSKIVGNKYPNFLKKHQNKQKQPTLQNQTSFNSKKQINQTRNSNHNKLKNNFIKVQYIPRKQKANFNPLIAFKEQLNRK